MLFSKHEERRFLSLHPMINRYEICFLYSDENFIIQYTSFLTLKHRQCECRFCKSHYFEFNTGTSVHWLVICISKNHTMKTVNFNYIFNFKMFTFQVFRDIFLFQEAISAKTAMALNCPLETCGISSQGQTTTHMH